MRKFVCITLLLLSCLSALGQRADLRKGNREFRKGQYDKADISYRKALMQDTSSVTAKYNLANNLYRQENLDEAAKLLDAAKEAAPEAGFASDYYFNRGDVAIGQEDWQAAVDAFKESLLLNPGDLDAKRNYIYARNKLMEQQQQQQDQQNQDNQDQNQNQDQQNQDQNQDQQNQDQNQDQSQQDQNQNQDQQQQQQQPQNEQGQLSAQQAQQLLQAIQDKEKQTQEKVDEKKAQAVKSRQKEKNW